MALIKARWETILSIYLQGTSGAYCVIQRKGSKYRVSVGDNAWEAFNELQAAAKRATEYQAQYNDIDSVQYVDAIIFFKQINWL
jgi:hypothetical protein